MKVIAKRGDFYLVAENLEPTTAGYVVDIIVGKRHRPINVHSILAQGYWESIEAGSLDVNLEKRILEIQ